MARGLIAESYARARADIASRGFGLVLLLGVALNVALLLAAWALVVGLALAGGEGEALPLVGEVQGVGSLLSSGALLLLALISPVLMVPVSSAFTGLFLNDVADRVEARHYPNLPPARRVAPWDGFVANVNLLGVLLAANVAAVIWVYPGVGIVGTLLLFVGLNAALLGREYLVLAALRRMDPPAARRLHLRNLLAATGAGGVLTVMLLVPGLNLVAPVLGAAAFTHLCARLAARPM